MWSCDILVLLSLCVWTCGWVLSQVMLYSYVRIYQDTYYIAYDITCIGILYTYRSTCLCACDKCLPSFFMFCGSLVERMDRRSLTSQPNFATLIYTNVTHTGKLYYKLSSGILKLVSGLGLRSTSLVYWDILTNRSTKCSLVLWSLWAL